jgi:hypothetical protein
VQGLSRPSAPESTRTAEVVGIGLNESGKYSGKPPRAKIKTFKPSLYEGRLELSTYSMDALQDPARWDLLDSHSNKPPIPARCELGAADVAEAELALELDWEPERHVNLIGWSGEEEKQASAAQALHRAHKLFLRRD